MNFDTISATKPLYSPKGSPIGKLSLNVKMSERLKMIRMDYSASICVLLIKNSLNRYGIFSDVIAKKVLING